MKKYYLLLFITIISFNKSFGQKFIERGLAEMIKDSQNTGKMMALHRTLTRGKEVRLRNPANGKKVKVKIIGKIPNTGANTKVVVKVSEAAYKALNASGKKFPIEIYELPKDKKVKHIVKKGDTLYSLSKKYNVSVEDIKDWNDLDNNTLSLNQEIIIIKKAK